MATVEEAEGIEHAIGPHTGTPDPYLPMPYALYVPMPYVLTGLPGSVMVVRLKRVEVPDHIWDSELDLCSLPSRTTKQGPSTTRGPSSGSAEKDEGEREREEAKERAEEEGERGREREREKGREGEGQCAQRLLNHDGTAAGTYCPTRLLCGVRYCYGLRRYLTTY
eukprot:2318329-Rhodomonas_salina.1